MTTLVEELDDEVKFREQLADCYTGAPRDRHLAAAARLRTRAARVRTLLEHDAKQSPTLVRELLNYLAGPDLGPTRRDG